MILGLDNGLAQLGLIQREALVVHKRSKNAFSFATVDLELKKVLERHKAIFAMETWAPISNVPHVSSRSSLALSLTRAR